MPFASAATGGWFPERGDVAQAQSSKAAASGGMVASKACPAAALFFTGAPETTLATLAAFK